MAQKILLKNNNIFLIPVRKFQKICKVSHERKNEAKKMPRKKMNIAKMGALKTNMLKKFKRSA